MITQKQYITIEQLFDYYNKKLFSNELPDILINLGRKSGAHGFFAYGRWLDEGYSLVHEITINPDLIKDKADKEMHQTLVHEMCHLWQYSFGKPSRRGYHNKEFADKMISVGLMPSTTGAPGGNQVGQKMSDFAIEGGVFEKAFDSITRKGSLIITLPYEPNKKYQSQYYTQANVGDNDNTEEDSDNHQQKKNKIKYSCPCGSNVWGKPGLNIFCGECNENFSEN